jgi:hypothetical protein
MGLMTNFVKTNEGWKRCTSGQDQAAEKYEVWDEEKGRVNRNRTGTCGFTYHPITAPGMLIILRRCDEVEVFVNQWSNIAKVLQLDQETGSRVYFYRKPGDDQLLKCLRYVLGWPYC